MASKVEGGSGGRQWSEPSGVKWKEWRKKGSGMEEVERGHRGMGEVNPVRQHVSVTQPEMITATLLKPLEYPIDT